MALFYNVLHSIFVPRALSNVSEMTGRLVASASTVTPADVWTLHSVPVQPLGISMARRRAHNDNIHSDYKSPI